MISLCALLMDARKRSLIPGCRSDGMILDVAKELLLLPTEYGNSSSKGNRNEMEVRSIVQGGQEL
jgi:hypothetical protein